MEVVLLEKIHNLGNLGDSVKVKSGYARNYLMPQGKAIAATKANIKVFEEKRAELEKIALEHLNAAQARADKVTAVAQVTIVVNAGEEGKLFGSVGTKDIADAITAAGVEINKSEVRLPEGVLRQVGEYDIAIQVHSEVTTQLKVVLEAEEVA